MEDIQNPHAFKNKMIFDILTPPQGHQFDPSAKILLVFYSTYHPLQRGIPDDHVWKKINFWRPSTPKSHTLGMNQATE